MKYIRTFRLFNCNFWARHIDLTDLSFWFSPEQLWSGIELKSSTKRALVFPRKLSNVVYILSCCLRRLSWLRFSDSFFSLVRISGVHSFADFSWGHLTRQDSSQICYCRHGRGDAGIELFPAGSIMRDVWRAHWEGSWARAVGRAYRLEHDLRGPLQDWRGLLWDGFGSRVLTFFFKTE